MRPNFLKLLFAATLLLCAAIASLLVLYYLPSGPQPLPTITQIQQELVNRGHDIKADGRLGPATQKAWDEEINKGIIYKNFESVIEADRKAMGY